MTERGGLRAHSPGSSREPTAVQTPFCLSNRTISVAHSSGYGGAALGQRLDEAISLADAHHRHVGPLVHLGDDGAHVVRSDVNHVGSPDDGRWLQTVTPFSRHPRDRNRRCRLR
jgi:hypothetical protein